MSMRYVALPLLVVSIVAGTASAASAATLTVNTTTDETTAGDGLCSLREAIQAVDTPGSANGDCAPAAFGANTIVLAAKTYRLGASSSSPGVELSVSGTVTNLTISGAGESKTAIDATALGDRALKVDAGATVVLTGLTVTGGHAGPGSGTTQSGGAPGENGGAILTDGSLTLNDVAVTYSQAGTGSSSGTPAGAGGSGGAIFNDGSLDVVDATIAGNQAGPGGTGATGQQGSPNGQGGGIGGTGGSGGAIASTGSLIVTASTIRGNSAGPGGSGGDGGPSGASGGGGAGGAGGTGGDGGGIARLGGAFSAINNTFASNQAGDGGAGGAGGGAVGLGGSGGRSGDGGSGGGVFAVAPAGGQLLSSTLAGNSAGNAGEAGTAGIGSPDGSAGSAGNQGAGGGVSDQNASLSIQNSLLAQDSGGNCSGTVVDGGQNLSFDGSGCPATFAGRDPNLGALQNNGGPTLTISLGPGSAAIDQAPATGAGCPATDQRGVRRPGGSACDIGAYEVAKPIATTGSSKRVGLTRERVFAKVTPNSGSAMVSFKYGAGKRLRFQTRPVKVSGVTTVPAAATLRKLKLGDRYRYRVVIQSSAGTALGRVRSFLTRAHATTHRRR